MSLPALVFSAILFPVSLFPQTNEDCEACHSDPGLKTERQGRTISLFVDSRTLASSVHRGLECTACHTDAAVEEFPHPERLARVGCGACHTKADEEFSTGIHGKAYKRGAPYAPTCKECHGEHDILPPLKCPLEDLQDEHSVPLRNVPS